MKVHEVLDAAKPDDARKMLLRCCGAKRWADSMEARRPFGSDEALFKTADELWARMKPADVREALAHHPRIGASMDELKKKYGSTAAWAAGEQSGAQSADEATLLALRDGNAAYEERFGYVFVVCATGKSAAEMLAILESRLKNDADTEIAVAAAEQGKILRIRLEKLA